MNVFPLKEIKSDLSLVTIDKAWCSGSLTRFIKDIEVELTSPMIHYFRTKNTVLTQLDRYYFQQ